MKRTLSMLLVALLALAMLAGCNSDAPSSSTPSDPNTSSEAPSEPEPTAPEPMPELDTPSGSGTAKMTTAGYGGPLSVTLTVEDDVITAVEVDAQFETPDIGVTAAEAMEAAILESGNLEVDTVAGATVTSDAILLASRQALAEIAG